MTSTSWEEFKKLMDLSHEDEFDFQSAIQVHSLEDYNPTKFSEWPAYMLREIMSLSDDILKMPDGIRERQNHNKKHDQPSDTKILAQIFHTDQSFPHPMDIFLYLFSVCDKVFRQTFCSHVAKCQLALPLITMDPILQTLKFYNFAFKTLTKDYYSTNVDLTIKESKSFSVNEEKLPIVSFIRVGDCAYSLKSQILNGILGMNHSYFFNSICRDNVKNAYFFRGSIEIGWFLPGKKKEFIEKPFVLLNLRGNACHLQTQVNFLSKASTHICVFIPCNILNNEIEKTILDIKKDYEDKLLYLLYESPKNIQTNEINSASTSSFLSEYLAKTEQKLILNDGNAKNYAIILTREIKTLIDVNIPNLSLTNCTDIARQHEITVDCDDGEILNVSTNKIQDILEILNSSINSFNLQGKIALAEVKNRYLPLQGAQWKKWAESNRKILLIKSDISGKTLDESKKEIGENMKNARKEQFRLLKNPSDLLNILLELIPSEIPSSVNDAIIITWKVLENELNTISLEYLPILHQKYEKFLRDSSSSEANATECVDYQQELLKTSMDIINSSFGIEHFFREFGQVYETCAKYKNMQSKLGKNWNIKNMPQLIAKLILAGHSFEIMDGDVNHVPIEWVKKVLECLAKFIGSDKKLFVLSILGTQSSGKSTLLNTMFGVNFAVSSGRCTRGVFMQVIPINEELAKSTLGYDYLVLLDTEGLRAKEQIGPNYRFDNELATFVIGLGDLTLVNMRSEMYTEIEDIIQVTVMALIRMNISIKLRPKCIFVHQNVPCPHANNNLKHIKAELIQTLDRMTVIAAEREKMDKINRFCDVIEFDPNSDVFYFPSLNDGVPPIARVSSDYSRCARELKYKILTISRGHTTFQSLNDWIFKISTIWESVLKENFAFSYKNILQIHCRFELDSALCNWSSDYCHAMLADKSEKIHFLLNTSPNDIDSELSKIKCEILKLSEGTLKEAQNILMENFFMKHIYASIFFQWENLAETHFRTLRIKEKKRNLLDCEQVVNIQKEKFRMDRAFTEFSNKLVSQTVTYFKDIRRNNSFCDGTPIQPLFIEKFNKSLNDWSSGFMLNCMLQSNVVNDCQHAIIDSPFLQSMYIISDKIYRLTKLDEYREFGRRSFSYKDKPYYNIIKAENRHRFLGNLFNSDKKLALNSFLQNLQQISDKVQTFLNESILQKLEYSSECYSLLINYIYHEIEKINKEQRKNIEFCIELSNDFIFDYIFYKCCNAISKFEGLQEVLDLQTNLKNKLEKFKADVKSLSISCLQDVQTEYSCAEKLVNIILVPMQNYLATYVSNGIIALFKSKNLIILSSRVALQSLVLEDLANTMSFDDYINYILHPIDYLAKWITQKLKDFINDETILNQFYQTLLSKITTFSENYTDAAKKATKNSKESDDRWTDWKKTFHSEIINAISDFQINQLKILDICMISDYEQFEIFFSEILKVELFNKFDWLAWLKNVLIITKLPLDIVITDHLLGCRALCPFCSEPCRLVIGEHEHYCGSFHRPQGVNGIRELFTLKITTEECTTSILTKMRYIHHDEKEYKYEDYKTINAYFKSWNILADDARKSKYWQWVLYKFQSEFLNYYNIKSNPIIDNYSYLTQEDIIEDMAKLNHDFNMKIGAILSN